MPYDFGRNRELAADARRLDQIAEMRATYQHVLAGDRRRTMALDTAARLSPTAQRLASVLWTYASPRLSLDEHMPMSSLQNVVEGVDASNLRRSRKMIGDRVRRFMKNRLSSDADIDDLEQLLRKFEDEEGEEGEDEVEGPEPPPWSTVDPRQEQETYDRRRRMTADDPLPFPGRPQTGGRMDPMETQL
jgi:hypothetical protein